MLEIKFLRQNLSAVKKAFKNRGENVDLDTLLASDERRRARLLEVEDLRHNRNTVSEEIAGLKKSGENADALVAEMRQVSEKIKSLEKILSEDENTIQTILLILFIIFSNSFLAASTVTPSRHSKLHFG